MRRCTDECYAIEVYDTLKWQLAVIVQELTGSQLGVSQLSHDKSDPWFVIYQSALIKEHPYEGKTRRALLTWVTEVIFEHASTL